MKSYILRNRCAQYRAPQIAKAKGIYPYYKAIESEQSTVVKIDGKDVLMFSSNSYLGLSNDPRLKEAAKAAKEAEKAAKEKEKKSKNSIASKVLRSVITAVTGVAAGAVADKVTGTKKKSKTSTTKKAVTKATKSATTTLTRELTRSILGNLIK